MSHRAHSNASAPSILSSRVQCTSVVGLGKEAHIDGKFKGLSSRHVFLLAMELPEGTHRASGQ